MLAKCGNTAERRRERKRQSDRLAQRTVRQRTRQRIADLEREVQTLRAANPNQVLDEKSQEIQLLRDQNLQLQRLVQRIGNLCETQGKIQQRQGEATRTDQTSSSSFHPSENRLPSSVLDLYEQDYSHEEDSSTGQLVASNWEHGEITLDAGRRYSGCQLLDDELSCLFPGESWTAPAHVSDGSGAQYPIDGGSEAPGVIHTSTHICHNIWDSPTGYSGPRPPLLPLPSPETVSVGSFQGWIQDILFIYDHYAPTELEALLPRSPCLGAIVAPKKCHCRLSKELADLLRDRYKHTDFVVLAGAYWCLHMLLRYYLNPDEDQLARTPSNMHPIPTQKRYIMHWAHFLPWPHLRQALLVQPTGLLTLELERTISEGTYLYWPFGVDAAIDLRTSEEPHSGSHCTSALLTDSFKSHIAQAHNWCLKPVTSDLPKRFPAVGIVTR